MAGKQKSARVGPCERRQLITGLVSDQPLCEVIPRMDASNAAARALGCDLVVPLMTLSFPSLSPIPALKLTDQELIDATHRQRTTLFV